ncbi:MAG: acyltransferase family protein [Chitinophagaceae bacterium]
MKSYIKSLDGIRGFGIFFVMAYHFLRLQGVEWTTIGFSWIWIQMFFVQSGFLITQILLNSKDQPFQTYAGQFYWRRMLRIFPVYFAYLLAFLLLYIIFHKPDDFGERAPYLFTFTYNYTRLLPDIEFHSTFFIHFWSLSVEEQFYLFWPVVVFFLDIEKLKKVIVAIILLVPFFRYWFADHLLAMGFSPEMTGETTYAFTISQLDSFMTGAAITVFNLPEKIKRPGRWSLLAIAIVVTAGLTNYALLINQGQSISISSLGFSVAMIENYQHVWSYSLINLLFAVVIVYLISANYKGIFNNALLVRIGKIVYGIYIYHFGILWVFSTLNKRYIHSLTISFTLACLGTYLLAFLSYQYYEKKFLSFKDFWNRKN